MIRPLIATLLCATTLSACTMAPRYERPALPVGSSWPAGAPQEAQAASAATRAWREVFTDPRLQQVIDLALAQNRDLRVAVLNIEQAKAQYQIQRSGLLPGLNASLSGPQARSSSELTLPNAKRESGSYSATVGLAAYELDLFGRVRSLSEAALQSYFAVEENRRAAQISLISEVASAYLTLAADEDLLGLASDTLKTREDSSFLIRKRFEAGAASQLEARQAETLLEQARTDVAASTARVAQDRNALRLLVGAEVPAELLPTGGLATIRPLEDLPAGTPSEVLLNRPDVLSAEHALKGRNANIGAARAAFFPRISLTGATGSASGELGGLFANGTGAWSFTPSISLPIFSGGANVANLRGAEAGRDIAVAQYEKTIQTAFREVSDALAVQATANDRVASQERLVAAANDSQRLSGARYERGVDGYLTLLDAQRTAYAARQSLIATRLVRETNLVTLYRTLGGGTR